MIDHQIQQSQSMRNCAVSFESTDDDDAAAATQQNEGIKEI